MLLVEIVSVMILVAMFGRTTTKITPRGYLLIFILSILQVGFVLVYAYTLDLPPLI